MEPCITFAQEVFAKLLSYVVAVRGGTDARLAPLGLTMIQFVVLREVVNATPSVAPKDIARVLRLSRATTSRVLLQLDEAGLIDVWGCDEDRRRHSAVITPAGAQRYLNATSALGGGLLFHAMGRVELNSLYVLIGRIPTMPRNVEHLMSSKRAPRAWRRLRHGIDTEALAPLESWHQEEKWKEGQREIEAHRRRTGRAHDVTDHNDYVDEEPVEPMAGQQSAARG